MPSPRFQYCESLAIMFSFLLVGAIVRSLFSFWRHDCCEMKWPWSFDTNVRSSPQHELQVSIWSALFWIIVAFPRWHGKPTPRSYLHVISNPRGPLSHEYFQPQALTVTWVSSRKPEDRNNIAFLSPCEIQSERPRLCEPCEPV